MPKTFTTRMDTTNDGKEPLVLYVEPWGHDFTLAPGQTFTLVASSEVDMPYFAQSIQGGAGDVAVYLEGPNDISFAVLEGQRELACGHGRVAPQGGSLPNTSLERTRDR
ncbi:MAG: hypothetical protein IT489_02975 [Gammaproteobacteria bacterium]|nr:hypothetical protein [Gammaproteobacteria bacterium]